MKDDITNGPVSRDVLLQVVLNGCLQRHEIRGVKVERGCGVWKEGWVGVGGRGGACLEYYLKGPNGIIASS